MPGSPPSRAPTPHTPWDPEACSPAHLCVLLHHGPLHLLVPFPVSPVVKVHREPGWLRAERASPEGGSSMEGTGQPHPRSPGTALWGGRRLFLHTRGDWVGWVRAGRGGCPFACGCRSCPCPCPGKGGPHSSQRAELCRLPVTVRLGSLGALCWGAHVGPSMSVPGAGWSPGAVRGSVGTAHALRLVLAAGRHTHLDVLLGDAGPGHFLLPFPHKARDGAVGALLP